MVEKWCYCPTHRGVGRQKHEATLPRNPQGVGPSADQQWAGCDVQQPTQQRVVVQCIEVGAAVGGGRLWYWHVCTLKSGV